MGWGNSRGYYVVERAIQAKLVNERYSVQSLFQTLVSQAFTHRIAVRLPAADGVEIWKEGSRPWGLRGLAATAEMSINTLRKALDRLAALGLIKRVSNKLGTMIQVKRFFQFCRKNENADRDIIAEQADAEQAMTQRGDTRVSLSDPYRVPSSNTFFGSSEDPIDVPTKNPRNEFTGVKPGTPEGNRVKDWLRQISGALNGAGGGAY